MKSFIVLAALVAVAFAAPASQPRSPDADAVVLRQDLDNIGVEGFKYAYETSNGISQQEEGTLANPGTENEGIEVRGQYAYTGPDGVNYLVIYTAGAAGFQPQGAHIPQA